MYQAATASKVNPKKVQGSEMEKWFRIFKKSETVSFVFVVPSFNAEV